MHCFIIIFKKIDVRKLILFEWFEYSYCALSVCISQKYHEMFDRLKTSYMMEKILNVNISLLLFYNRFHILVN
jgi:hypothetical protein